jgi:prephenate dehydrogenase
MGAWFTKYFSSKGHSVVLYDSRTADARLLANRIQVEAVKSLQKAVEDAELVLVSVPIPMTSEVIREVVGHMSEGAVLVEISSLKVPTNDVMRWAAKRRVLTLSLHPLFGPAATSLKGQTILLVPVLNCDSELKVARQLFSEAEVSTTSLLEHDRAMALVLSVPYSLNIAFAGLLGDEKDISMLKRMAGTTFTVQLALVGSVVGEDPHLVEALLNENELTSSYIERLVDELRTLNERLKGDQEEFHVYLESLKRSMEDDPDYVRADEMRYRMFMAVKEQAKLWR